MSQQQENHIMDIPPPEYTNEMVNPQNENVESTHQNLVHSPTPPQHYDAEPPRLDFSTPLPYEDYNPDLMKLPTYEEVQMEKSLEGEMSSRLPGRVTAGLPSIGPLPQEISAPTLNVITPNASNLCEIRTRLLGTDYMFLTAFLVALLFNWVGFLVLICVCQTVASRCGALAGFGLSLAKWIMIVKHKTVMGDLSPENSSNAWIWWIVMAFGFLICIRAVVQYRNIKRGWRLLSVPAHERVLYLY